MTDKSDWPEWLRNARTESADVEIRNGVVIWCDGTWCDGDWRGGVWHGGDWCGGVWRDGDWRGGVWHGGTWCGGVWRDGVWYDGTWRGGTWHGGTWCGGVWRDGDWRGGYDNPTRCMSQVRGRSDRILIGYKTYSLEEIEALCKEGKLPPGVSSGDSEADRLLRAAVLAQIAWQKALSGGV